MNKYISALDVDASQIRGLLYRAESYEGVYKPKRVGRRTDRYKRYFGAKTPPLGGYSFISLVFRGHWKACSKHYLIK